MKGKKSIWQEHVNMVQQSTSLTQHMCFNSKNWQGNFHKSGDREENKRPDTWDWNKEDRERKRIISKKFLILNVSRKSKSLAPQKWQIIIVELRQPKGPPSRAPYPIWETQGNPWVDFLMVIMASGIACGRVRTTATVSRKMAVILQIINRLTGTWILGLPTSFCVGKSIYLHKMSDIVLYKPWGGHTVHYVDCI